MQRPLTKLSVEGKRVFAAQEGEDRHPGGKKGEGVVDYDSREEGSVTGGGEKKTKKGNPSGVTKDVGMKGLLSGNHLC